MGRWELRPPPRCGPPSGLKTDCTSKPTCFMRFASQHASGGWYLCDLCTVRVMMWLEDQRYYDHTMVVEREAVDGAAAP